MAFGWVWCRLAMSSWCPLAAYGSTLWKVVAPPVRGLLEKTPWG